ncbi:MAG: IclR family transcriptional regulator [Planctomycetes bacterium]|nr:IclR family transcriptional regulator [Planctomycetota bacterium]
MPRRPKKEPEGGRYRAPALDKGLDILELLAHHPDGLTQAEIARALDRSVGEIFRMLARLVERGWVAIRRPGDGYVLTLKLFELAHRFTPMDRLLTDALPLMKELSAAVHQSCHLTVLEGGRGIVLAQVDAPGEMGFAVRVGSTMSLPPSCSGRVLLAFQHEADRERLLERMTAAERKQAAALAKQLAKVRERGFEEMESSRVRGVHDLSVPVFDPRGHVLGALTMPYLQRIDLGSARTIAEARGELARTARTLSARIEEADADRSAPRRGEKRS